MINHYIRGGQIFLHKIRMFTQVWWNNLLFAIIFSIIIVSYNYYPKFSSIDLAATTTYTKALLTNKMDNVFEKEKSSKISAYSAYGKFSNNIAASKVISLPFFRRKFERAISIIFSFVNTVIAISTITFSLIILIWHSFGKISSKASIISGNKILSAKIAAKILRQKNMDSNIKIGDLPLVKPSKSPHILFSGTTGTGKTTSMNIMLEQIRSQNQPAIIIDYNGQMSEKFFREGDIIIGKGEHSWDFFEDVRDPNNLAIIANALYEGKGGSWDEMWNNASKNLFKDGVSIVSQNPNPTISELYDLLAKEPLNSLHSKLSGYFSYSMLDPSNEKTALSVRTNCLAYLDWMEGFSDSMKKISISNWIRESDNNGGKCIFLKANPKERTSLQKLYTILIELIINEIMSLEESQDRRMWLVIDELPSLRKMPSITIALSEFRKYGASIIASLQSPHQLFDIYGNSNAYSMLDQFGTKFIFRTEEYNFANYLCKILGNVNYVDKSENYSYGSHEVRDGVSISSIEKQKPLLTPNDLAALDNFESYVFLPLREAKIVKIKII